MTGCVYRYADDASSPPCLLRRGKADCRDCAERLPLDAPDFAERWTDPLEIVTRDRTPTDALRNVLAGASVFLACGGPSASDLPLEDLNRRGVWTMCVNNMAGHARFRPQAFLCSDPPLKFSHSIWLDPAVMKFVPTPKLCGRSRTRLKRKVDGEFVSLNRRTTDCPNVWGFKRWSWLSPDERFFLTDGACWGNQDAGVKRTGEEKTVCTMLLGMRLLRYLGARRVFLIGVDFRMSREYGYSFAQGNAYKYACKFELKKESGLFVCRNCGGTSRTDTYRDCPAKSDNSDNRQYAVVNRWLCRMEERGVFRRFGVEFFNCYERSGLRAFPHVPFGTAVEAAQGLVEDEPDLAGWYEKK